MSSMSNRRPRRSLRRGAAGISLALAVALAPGAVPTILMAPASAAVSADGQTQIGVPEYRAAGNDMVDKLYADADAGVPRPGNMDIWPTDDINQSLNIQTQSNQQSCAVTMMGQSQGFPMRADGVYADVDRNFAQTTPRVTRNFYDQRPHFDNGYMLTRPATDADSEDSLTTSGRVQVTSADAGYLTLAMDGWGNKIGVSSPNNIMQHSRLRLATKEPIENFRLVLRMDKHAKVDTRITTMGNWNGWWAPGYTQAPSSNFTITYETDADGLTYAVIEADEVPAESWATVTFRGEVLADDFAEGGQLYSWSAATADFSTLQCEAPLPQWDKQTVRPGDSVTVENTGDAIPQGTQPDATTAVATPPEGWGEIAIDAETGVLTAEVPGDAAPGDYTFPVEMTYGDGTTKTVEVTITVLPMPTYEDTTVQQGEEKTVPVPVDQSGEPLPEGTEFAPGEGGPDWATVNEDGTITVNPGYDVPEGEYTVPVVVTRPDGSTENVEAKVTVENPNDPAYETETVDQGETVTVPAPTNPDGSSLPEGSEFAPGDDVPDWVTVNEDGTLTVSPGTEVTPGGHTFPVVVTYPDGSEETIQVTVVVNNPNDPAYETGIVDQGETITIPTPENPDGSALPEGTEFAPGEDVPDWVTVNEDGTLTVSPGANVTPGGHTFPVVVTYPDGTSETIDVTVVVNNPNDPAFETGIVDQGETITIPAPSNPDGSALPEGSEFAPGDDTPDWVTVNEDGTLTVSPGADVTPGGHTFPIVVTYPDGSEETIQVTVVVNNPNDPAYETGIVDQGETITIPTPTNPDGSALPGGSEYAPGDDTPDWVTVNEDGTLTVSPGADVTPGGHTFPVVVTYPDGTSETIQVTVVVNNPNTPIYEDGEVDQGETITIPTPENPDGSPLPEGTEFAPGDDTPDWVTVNEDGTITVSPDESVTPGDHTFPVVVTYPDGSEETVDVTVTVNNPNDPVYENGEVEQGETITIPTPENPDGSPLPEGTEFAPGDDTPDWVTVNEDGTLTVSPGTDVEPGEHTFPVVVTYPDGSSETIEVTVTVTEPGDNGTGPGDDDNGSDDSNPGDGPSDEPGPKPGDDGDEAPNQDPGDRDQGDRDDSPLPRTGVDVAATIAAAVLLLGLGAGLILRARRRS
ncbi:Rib/alpha-like domain-containing protein [Brevibacterium sp. CS2]|uniref:Rib/alpha-like domain-containing protein n=1 Tax=Brevibacterium sp. CS2 TaxID=2575923 RepID=UPI0010C79AE2|nr:Rib/alpha-like domain-containing protein [Brevibacterium sp. CS2]QCP04433.1 hypothetical protein FDF13_03235 [Brevibacterium sp. CS2]